MNKLLSVITILVALSATNEARAGTPTTQDIRACNVVSDQSRNIMTFRQEGYSYEGLVSTYDGNPEILKAFHKVIILAYSKRVQGSNQTKQVIIDDFADKMFIACLES